jgi:hypothetical protein
MTISLPRGPTRRRDHKKRLLPERRLSMTASWLRPRGWPKSRRRPLPRKNRSLPEKSRMPRGGLRKGIGQLLEIEKRTPESCRSRRDGPGRKRRLRQERELTLPVVSERLKTWSLKRIELLPARERT